MCGFFLFVCWFCCCCCCSFGKNKRLKSYKRASGRERRRKKAEEAEDNPPLEPTACRGNEGTSSRAAVPATAEPAGAPASADLTWKGETKGRWAVLGLEHRADTVGLRREGRDSLFPNSHSGYFSTAIFLSPPKPLPQGQGALGYAFQSFNAPRIVTTSSLPWEDPRQDWSSRNTLLRKEGEFLPLF